jgi:hypothetical protein
MKFTVQRETLTRLISKAQGIVEKKSTLRSVQVMLESLGAEGVRMGCRIRRCALGSCPAKRREGGDSSPREVPHDVLKNLSGGQT